MRKKKLVRIGRSRGLIVDKAILDLLGWGPDQEVTVTMSPDGAGLLLIPEGAPEPIVEARTVTAPKVVKRRPKADGSEMVVALWRELCVPAGLSDVRTKDEGGAQRPVGANLRRSICARLREEPSEEWWRKFFERVQSSDFLTGRSTSWRCSLPWLMKPANLEKVLAGQYDSAKSGGATQTRSIDYTFADEEWAEPSF